MRELHKSLALAFGLVLAILPAWPYAPAADTAGPLTVRIQEPSIGLYGAGGPVQLTSTETPFNVTISLENGGGEPLKGTLRVGVIDQWRVEPSTPVAFTVAPRGRSRMEFRVAAGRGTYNAHYPIHAWAEFDYQGRRMTAHPVLILATQLSNPPRARLPVEWKPVAVPSNGAIGLWRIPVHREVAAVAPPEFEAGSTGSARSEVVAPAQFGSSVRRGAARDAITARLGLRPPSLQERVQSVCIAYPLALPAGRPVRLRFANAVSDRSTAPVVFRLRVAAMEASCSAGKVVFERPTDAKTWQEGEANLADFAGQSVLVAFEAEAKPGATADAYWAEPTIVTRSGDGASAPREPEKPRSLGIVKQAGSEYGVRIRPGSRGILDSTLEFTTGNRRLSFQGFRVRVLGDALEDSRSANELAEVREEPASGRYRLRHHFRGWAGSFDLLSELWVEKQALRARFWLENVPPPRPWLNVYLEVLAAGPWSDVAERVYAGVGNVIEKPGSFRLGFDGHNLATSYVGLDFANGMSLLEGVDSPPDRLEVEPEARIYSLVTPHAQTLTFVPAPNAWAAVKVWRDLDQRKPAAGVKRLAGRFVFDLWGGARYAEAAASLEKAFRYGLTDSLVVWHNWQRWGYDYRLPDIYPPSPALGSLEEFAQLARTCDRAGVLFAPHDNYIDFYPDADEFTYENIVFNRDGTPQRAWYNSGRQAQSYRARADRVTPFLQRNLRLIQDGIRPSAYFIDVWSSMGPYDYWTNKGEFFDRSLTRKVWGESFAWIRDLFGNNAPQISEAGHDQLIGWLDGAQANHLRVQSPPGGGFFWPIANADAERIPWYDAAYHDRIVLHGAGYPDRYAAGLDSAQHGIYSDDYIATEVLTGHPAMVSQPFSRDVVRKYWLLHDVMSALALRQLDEFEFAGGNLHRQHVRWAGGGEVWVNRGAEDWPAGAHLLAPYGFRVHVPVPPGLVEASVERRGKQVIEWARSPSAVYANARGGGMAAFDFGATDGAFRLTRNEGGVVQLTPLPGSVSFVVRLRWDALGWNLPAPGAIEAIDEQGRVTATSAVRKDGGDIVLECEPGVFAYRLR